MIPIKPVGSKPVSTPSSPSGVSGAAGVALQYLQPGALNLGARYGIAAGRPANLLVLGVESDYEAVRQQTKALYSIRNGRVLMKREPEQVTLVEG